MWLKYNFNESALNEWHIQQELQLALCWRCKIDNQTRGGLPNGCIFHHVSLQVCKSWNNISILIKSKHLIKVSPSQTLESRLKITLPEDLGEALSNGTVLCQLVNHIRPRSVSIIHIPSPAVVNEPSLSFFQNSTENTPDHVIIPTHELWNCPKHYLIH